ncbi:hypothetical protein [Prochlorococcus marinus]|uniref:hypothetical protein n=1 Tax=Prochlorococcus marinus TaxID=1219 RepID=UPI0022B36A43|nr:hypothetical protein [Prochlorococcus marinus]
MKSQINHIGIRQAREQGFRYKRLIFSGIFQANNTTKKNIDCEGTFYQWTNETAIKWIHARVKEQKEGRKVHIVCNCCDFRDIELTKIHKIKTNDDCLRVNPSCYGDEIVELIKSLA